VARKEKQAQQADDDDEKNVTAAQSLKDAF
jgi:hypothetical protein